MEFLAYFKCYCCKDKENVTPAPAVVLPPPLVPPLQLQQIRPMPVVYYYSYSSPSTSSTSADYSSEPVVLIGNKWRRA